MSTQDPTMPDSDSEVSQPKPAPKRGRPSGSTREPSYRRHKASGQAVVTINGRDHYLGAWDSPESRIKYYRLLEARVNGESVPAPSSSPADITCAELCAIYLRWATSHYVKDGEPTTELPNVKRALKALRQTFPALPAREFGTSKMKAVRQQLIADGLCRSTCNRYVAILTRVFRHAAEEELWRGAGEVWHSLQSLRPLERGRDGVRDTEPIGPVSDADVEATLPHMADPYRTMCRVMLVCGARPGEMMNLTPADVDTSGEVWLYRPRHHKTEHKGKSRVIPLGPQARLLLAPLWPTFPAQLVFRTRRGHKINRNLFGAAIWQACRKAGIERWSPNQLRHSAATKIRKQFGAEAAQIILGHSNLSTTEIYAEKNINQAVQIARDFG